MQTALEGARRGAPPVEHVSEGMGSEALLAQIMTWLDDAKAEKIVKLDLRGKSSIGDFMIVATGGDGGMEVYDFLLALAKAQKPIVSGVDGIAVGIGTTINLHCDLTLATPRTEFRTPFVDLGLVPEAGSSMLAPAVLGRQAAFALLGLGEGFSAERAKAAGLIYDVVSEDELEAAAMAAAERIAAKPPEALKIARDLMLGNREALVARIKEEGVHFRARRKSDEARNAFMAFMSRKKT